MPIIILMRGRPPKREAEKRTNMLRTMLTDGERAEIDEAANKVGLETSTWVRLRMLELAREKNAKKGRFE
jgi:hypothetical protein